MLTQAVVTKRRQLGGRRKSSGAQAQVFERSFGRRKNQAFDRNARSRFSPMALVETNAPREEYYPSFCIH